MALLTVLTHGLSMPDLGATVLRGGVGVFFSISGYHKLFHEGRRAGFISNLTRNGIPLLRFNSWWVPGVEFVAGATLALGLFTSLSALLLLGICIVACGCEAWDKVCKYNPIDGLDVLDDYLYLPEVIYSIILVSIILNGTGAYSLDAKLWN